MEAAKKLVEYQHSPQLELIVTPPLSKLTAKAKETVRADVLDAVPLMQEYEEDIENYLASIERRELVVSESNLVMRDGSKAARVRYSPFWEALDTMGQRLDYVIENNSRMLEREVASGRTRADWIELERDYVGFPPVVYEDEREPTYCAAWNCHNEVRLTGKRPSKYCSEKCRHEQKAAERRFKRTGTFLPVKAYEKLRIGYAQAKTTYKEVSWDAVPKTLATDGKDYREPKRRKLTVAEMTAMEMRRRYREHGETEYYNLKDTCYYIDEEGNYHVDNREWQEVKKIRRLFSWNNFI
ncbi:hypothetical protein FQU75_16630 [Paenibacillus polymyxa]|nr:hypothetical protein FQU75_16630 [Paenibacillus polymyxa]